MRYLIKSVNLSLYDLFRIVRIQLFGFWQVLQILPWHPKTQLILFFIYFITGILICCFLDAGVTFHKYFTNLISMDAGKCTKNVGLSPS